MSGWHQGDKVSISGPEFTATNIQTVGGRYGSDRIGSGIQSKNIVEAHFKSLRCFRRWCRFMPFIMFSNGVQKYTTPEQAKMQLAILWRQNGKMRDPDEIDDTVRHMYEKLYNIHQGDVWGDYILEMIAP